MSKAQSLHPDTPPVEHLIERAVFGSRWLLAPFYFGLLLGLVALLAKFVQRTIALLAHSVVANGDEIVVGILSLIDVSLIANLLFLVIFAGYEIVLRPDVRGHEARLDWMGQIGFGDLKLKLMASIIAISAVRVLEEFMTIEHLSDRDLAWLVGIHLVFVVSGVLLAVMDRVTEREH